MDKRFYRAISAALRPLELFLCSVMVFSLVPQTSGSEAPVFAGNTIVNVSARENLDTVVANAPSSNVTFRLAAGTYVTNGLLPAGNSLQFIGQNPDRNTDSTIIKLSNTSTSHQVFKDSSGSYTPIDKFELWNLTIDCDFQHRSDTGVMTALFAVGSDIFVSGVHVMNYGTNATGTEDFPIFLGVQPPTTGFTAQHVHVEHCRFSPATSRNTDGITCIILPTQPGQANQDSAVIDCTFDNPTDTGITYYHCISQVNLISGCAATLSRGTFYYDEPGSWSHAVDLSAVNTLIQNNTVTLGPGTSRFWNLLWNDSFATTTFMGSHTLDSNRVTVSGSRADFARIDHGVTDGEPTNPIKALTLTNNVVTGSLKHFWWNGTNRTIPLTKSGNTLNGNPVQ
jgi:hypothetical protein